MTNWKPDPEEYEYGLELVSVEGAGKVDAVILAVAHEQFKNIGIDRLARMCCNGAGCGVVVDVKSVLDREAVEAQGLRYWSL